MNSNWNSLLVVASEKSGIEEFAAFRTEELYDLRYYIYAGFLSLFRTMLFVALLANGCRTGALIITKYGPISPRDFNFYFGV